MMVQFGLGYIYAKATLLITTCLQLGEMKLTCLRVSEVLMRGTCLYCNVYGLLWAIKEHAF